MVARRVARFGITRRSTLRLMPQHVSWDHNGCMHRIDLPRLVRKAFVFSLLVVLVSPVLTPTQAQLVDAYEPNNSAAAPSFALLSPPPTCANPQVLTNAVINPLNDLDFFRITPGAQRIFTVIVSAQIPITAANDLSLLVQLTDINGAGLQTQITPSGGAATITFYNLNANAIYHIRVQAQGAIAAADVKPYSISTCQSSNQVAPIPIVSPTQTPGPAGQDMFEGNNSPDDVLASTPVRSLLTFDKR
jgi:hypothetical protein